MLKKTSLIPERCLKEIKLAALTASASAIERPVQFVQKMSMLIVNLAQECESGPMENLQATFGTAHIQFSMQHALSWVTIRLKSDLFKGSYSTNSYWMNKE